jgi:hypothetical protein
MEEGLVARKIFYSSKARFGNCEPDLVLDLDNRDLFIIELKSLEAIFTEDGEMPRLNGNGSYVSSDVRASVTQVIDQLEAVKSIGRNVCGTALINFNKTGKKPEILFDLVHVNERVMAKFKEEEEKRAAQQKIAQLRQDEKTIAGEVTKITAQLESTTAQRDRKREQFEKIRSEITSLEGKAEALKIECDSLAFNISRQQQDLESTKERLLDIRQSLNNGGSSIGGVGDKRGNKRKRTGVFSCQYIIRSYGKMPPHQCEIDVESEGAMCAKHQKETDAKKGATELE